MITREWLEEKILKSLFCNVEGAAFTSDLHPLLVTFIIQFVVVSKEKKDFLWALRSALAAAGREEGELFTVLEMLLDGQLDPATKQTFHFSVSKYSDVEIQKAKKSILSVAEKSVGSYVLDLRLDIELLGVDEVNAQELKTINTFVSELDRMNPKGQLVLINRLRTKLQEIMSRKKSGDEVTVKNVCKIHADLLSRFLKVSGTVVSSPSEESWKLLFDSFNTLLDTFPGAALLQDVKNQQLIVQSLEESVRGVTVLLTSKKVKIKLTSEEVQSLIAFTEKLHSYLFKSADMEGLRVLKNKGPESVLYEKLFLVYAQWVSQISSISEVVSVKNVAESFMAKDGGQYRTDFLQLRQLGLLDQEVIKKLCAVKDGVTELESGDVDIRKSQVSSKQKKSVSTKSDSDRMSYKAIQEFIDKLNQLRNSKNLVEWNQLLATTIEKAMRGFVFLQDNDYRTVFFPMSNHLLQDRLQDPNSPYIARFTKEVFLQRKPPFDAVELNANFLHKVYNENPGQSLHLKDEIFKCMADILVYSAGASDVNVDVNTTKLLKLYFNLFEDFCLNPEPNPGLMPILGKAFDSFYKTKLFYTPMTIQVDYHRQMRILGGMVDLKEYMENLPNGSDNPLYQQLALCVCYAAFYGYEEFHKDIVKFENDAITIFGKLKQGEKSSFSLGKWILAGFRSRNLNPKNAYAVKREVGLINRSFDCFKKVLKTEVLAAKLGMLQDIVIELNMTHDIKSKHKTWGSPTDAPFHEVFNDMRKRLIEELEKGSQVVLDPSNEKNEVLWRLSSTNLFPIGVLMAQGSAFKEHWSAQPSSFYKHSLKVRDYFRHSYFSTMGKSISALNVDRLVEEFRLLYEVLGKATYDASCSKLLSEQEKQDLRKEFIQVCKDFARGPHKATFKPIANSVSFKSVVVKDCGSKFYEEILAVIK